MPEKEHQPGRANKSAYGSGAPAVGIANRRKQIKPSKSRSERSLLLDAAQSECQSHPQFNTVADYVLAMLADARDHQPEYGYADYCRDCNTFSRRFAAEGIRFATECLPDFFDALLSYLESGKSVYPGFKTPKSQQHPSFLQGLVGPIYADPCSSKAVKNIGLLYQVCVAFKKLEGTAKESVLREQLADFVQTDIDLSNVDWSQESARDIARDARKIIGEVLKGLDPFDPEQAADFRPRPGPGATNTPTKHAHRFRPWVWYDELMSVFNPDEWFSPPFAPPHVEDRCWGQNYPRFTRISRRKQKRERKYFHADRKPTSRYKLVPKSFKKWRGICIEENEVQWHQQGLRRGLYKRIESHPITKGFVNFTSQLVNRALALAGSVYQKWATIDMSSASDRILRKLVRYLFGENKSLLMAIEACSTVTVVLPKVKGFNFIEEMPIKKIAPMGSAICFPIMALVHFALIKAILNRSSIARVNSRSVYVYGDDIIVNRQCVQAIEDYLPLFGMKINTDKSFSRSYFRESCGLHAYKGAEVTPIRFKCTINSESSPQHLATALRLEEALYYKGWSRTAGLVRRDVLKVARKYGIHKVPYVNTKSPLFGFFRSDGDARLVDFVIDHKRRWIPACKAGEPWQSQPLNKHKCNSTWLYQKVAVIVDKFDDESSFLDEEDRYLRYLCQDGIWASNKYDEGYSRNTMFRKKDVIESGLGYRC
jgi:hypothetical protein